MKRVMMQRMALTGRVKNWVASQSVLIMLIMKFFSTMGPRMVPRTTDYFPPAWIISLRRVR
jgi:hypothetical protein